MEYTMPTYEYECKTCQAITEDFFRIADVKETIYCRLCGCTAKRVLSKPAVHCDAAVWIDDGLRGCLQKDGEKPIETKTELKEYCKAKDIVPVG